MSKQDMATGQAGLILSHVIKLEIVAEGTTRFRFELAQIQLQTRVAGIA